MAVPGTGDCMGACLVYIVNKDLGIISGDICGRLDQEDALVRGKGTADQTLPCWMVMAHEKKVGLNGSAILGTKRIFTHCATYPIHLQLPGTDAGPNSSNIFQL